MQSADRELHVTGANLKEVQSRQPIRFYCRQMWDLRHFILAQARSNAFKAGRDSFLGKTWIVLDPLLQVAIYLVVFGLILKASRGMDNYVGFLVVGVTFFGMISKGITSGVGSIQKFRGLISAFKFPRATLPIASVISQGLNNSVPAIIAIVLSLSLQIGTPIGFGILAIIPIYLLLHTFILGIDFWVSKITALIPDLGSLVNVIVRGLFFLSGVFFSVERFDTHPSLKLLIEINPIYQFLTVARDAILDSSIPSLEVSLYLLLWSGILLVSGFVAFWLGEEKYAQV